MFLFNKVAVNYDYAGAMLNSQLNENDNPVCTSFRNTSPFHGSCVTQSRSLKRKSFFSPSGLTPQYANYAPLRDITNGILLT